MTKETPKVPIAPAEYTALSDTASIAGRFVRLGIDDPWVRELVATDEVTLRARQGVKVIRDNDRVLVLRLPNPSGGPALYWKSYRPGSWLERLKDLFRPCAAVRAWKGSRRLQFNKIATARLVACAGPGPGHKDSFIITEELQDCLSVNAWLARFHEEPGKWAKRKHMLMRRMGALLARLRNANVYHTDMRPSNIFARLNDQGDFDLFLIDTDRVVGPLWAGLRESRRNLMQMMFCPSPEMTMTDRMRIVDAYVRARGERDPRAAGRALFLSSCRWMRRRLRALARGKPHLRSEKMELLSRLERLP